MEVRYIEIKTSPEGQIIRAYTPEQYKKEMARRKNATARARIHKYIDNAYKWMRL